MEDLYKTELTLKSSYSWDDNVKMHSTQYKVGKQASDRDRLSRRFFFFAKPDTSAHDCANL